jgi:hypothetical protein
MRQMIAAGLDGLRAAHTQLLAAHDDWIRECRRASRTLNYEDLVQAAQRMDEAFKQFMEAAQFVRLNVAKLQAVGRDGRRHMDLVTTGASFEALSKSALFLNSGEIRPAVCLRRFRSTSPAAD